MKRSLVVLAATALLAGVVTTNALAAEHGSFGGTFGGGHMGRLNARTFRGGGPFIGNAPSAPPPIFNPSSPYTVPQAPENPVSPASPGSVFGNG